MTTDHDDSDLDRLIDKALADLPRNDHDEIDHDAAIGFIAANLTIDVEAEKLRRARALVARRRKPGASPSQGQLCLDGLDPYEWEPDRLVLDDATDDGKSYLVENRRALARAKNAEAKRTMSKAKAAMSQAERRVAEASGHSTWSMKRVEDGEKIADLPFERYLRDTGAVDEGTEA